MKARSYHRIAIKPHSGTAPAAAAIFLLTRNSQQVPDGLPHDSVQAQREGSLPALLPTRASGRNALAVLQPEPKANPADAAEALRRAGAEAATLLAGFKVASADLHSQLSAEETMHFARGLVLGSYKFLQYKTEKPEPAFTELAIEGISEQQANELDIELDAVFLARDMVNEPVNYLTSEELGNWANQLGHRAGFTCEVFNLTRIQSLRMGGLLAVNAGSQLPPTFSVLEYKPANPVNERPLVLVGKGVVYDTGGLSLKPTPSSMDSMKSDMAGAAAVLAATYAIARLQLPVHVVTLIPATDNRPGENAITPGDVITMYSGKTVEILNTDAEGRLILGDALAFAQAYDPELVIDLATLTGAAARATGKEAIVFMGTAADEDKNALRNSGFDVGERLVELPLWDDYEEYMKSEVADLKNIGGADAGAITAGIFLKHFTDYPWLHLDIAGSAFIDRGSWNWRGKQGTGVGVRLLIDFARRRAGR